MPTLEENRNWDTYDWSEGGNEWSEPWGDTAQLWFGTILPRIHRALPAEHIVEIAPGHGRCTQFLIPYARRFSAVDFSLPCVEASSARFRAFPHAKFFQNDGRSLPMIESHSVDFVFSWDSLVHAEADVMADYAHEIARVLRPGGAAFLHHSNLLWALAAPEPIASEHWRGRSMSGELLLEQAAAAGLHCVTQELVPWRGEAFIDAWTTLVSPATGAQLPPTTIHKHVGFLDECALNAGLARRTAPMATAARPSPLRDRSEP